MTRHRALLAIALLVATACGEATDDGDANRGDRVDAVSASANFRRVDVDLGGRRGAAVASTDAGIMVFGGNVAAGDQRQAVPDGVVISPDSLKVERQITWPHDLGAYHPAAVSTGQDIIVLASPCDIVTDEPQDTECGNGVIGFSYQPAEDVWKELASPPTVGEDTTPLALPYGFTKEGVALFLIDNYGEETIVGYDVEAGSWIELGPLEEDAKHCFVGTSLLRARQDGEGTVFERIDPRKGEWSEVARMGPAGDNDPNIVYCARSAFTFQELGSDAPTLWVFDETSDEFREFPTPNSELPDTVAMLTRANGYWLYWPSSLGGGGPAILADGTSSWQPISDAPILDVQLPNSLGDEIVVVSRAKDSSRGTELGVVALAGAS